MNAPSLRKRVRILLGFFVVALVLSGLTAFPLQLEVGILLRFFGPGTWMEQAWPSPAYWIGLVHQGLTETNQDYPFARCLIIAHRPVGRNRRAPRDAAY